MDRYLLAFIFAVWILQKE